MLRLSVSILISFSLALANVAKADDTCPQNVQALNKGDVANCTGFLFSPAEESRVYLLDQNNNLLKQELDANKQLVLSYQSSLTNFKAVVDDEQQKSELWRKAAEDSTQKLVDIKNETGKRDLLMVLLGVILTGVAGYSIRAVSNSK